MCRLVAELIHAMVCSIRDLFWFTKVFEDVLLTVRSSGFLVLWKGAHFSAGHMSILPLKSWWIWYCHGSDVWVCYNICCIIISTLIIIVGALVLVVVIVTTTTLVLVVVIVTALSSINKIFIFYLARAWRGICQAFFIIQALSSPSSSSSSSSSKLPEMFSIVYFCFG